MTLLGQRAFDDLGTPLSDVPFCVLDLETTGLSPDLCEITEIGALRFEGGVETERFHTLVNPRAAIPATVTVVTGITQSMVIDAPLIEEALPSFLEFLGDAVIVGHNVRFDISFLNAAALRFGYGRLPNRSADTLRLARRLLGKEVRSLKLERLAAYLGSPVTPNHRAFDDAAATAHVFWALLERAGSVGVTHLDDLLALPTIKGSRAIGKLSLTEGLPRSPGVYIFRNQAGVPLYIGKATNLRSRVRSYFAGDERRRIDDLLRDTASIDHLATTCEIEAAVTELRLITEHAPRYNRRSKPRRTAHFVTLTDERHPRFSITRTQGRGLLQLGPFRSKRQADKVVRALWDATPIRRCTTPGRGCGFAQLGRAVCPCDGSVSDGEYRGIVDAIVHGIDHDPAEFATRVRSRLSSLAAHERFEEAADLRDAWSALTTALERRRATNSLDEAGTVLAMRDDVMVSIIGGHLEAAWKHGSTPPLRSLDTPAAGIRVEHVDEAMLLWRWLDDPRTRLVDVSGKLTTPSRGIPDLVALD